MKAAWVVLIIVHGLIHLLGFIKAFGLAPVEQLTQQISKPAGVVWLLSFVLFALTALLFALDRQSWFWVGIAACLISQTLIIYWWHDAKFGTIANVIILSVALFGYSARRFYSAYERDVREAMHQLPSVKQDLLTEADIAHLPEPVKRYLRYTKCIGQSKVKRFKIEFRGKMRKDEKSAWMPFTSEQYNFLDAGARLFFMCAEMKNLPVAGFHRLVEGRATMDIRLFSLFRVQYQEGPEMNIAETVTFFNDMCCLAPATLIDPRIHWAEISEDHVKATFVNQGNSISAELFFNVTGQLINFVSDDRYAADAGKRLPWSTPLSSYRDINGFRLAGYAEAIYTYPAGDLTYGVFEVVDIIYNGKQALAKH